MATAGPSTGPAAGSAVGPAVGPAAVPATVAGALGGVPSAGIGLATVRAGRAALMEALAKAGASGRVAVCDAETDADLDAIVAAALANDPATRLIGAGGLAAALGRAMNAAPGPTPLGPPPPPDGGPPAGVPFAGPPSPQDGRSFEGVPFAGRRSPQDGESSPDALLVVVGTAEPAAAEQARLLVAHGAEPVTLDATDLDAEHLDSADFDARDPDAEDPGAAGPRAGRGCEPVAGRVRRALAGGVAVLTVRGSAPPALTTILGRIVREALGTTRADLVLTGGETARRVLDALDVRELIPVGQVHHGAVHSRTPDGRSVVTRPGSFGGRDSLLLIAAHLRPGRFPTVSGTTIDERPT
ncbi:four-carbon acid sugar kinase family protein [Nonomuraea deserti]|uniref:four-carbon acid sugar kinase family protein n=1 Tax=Nonomuraea deserti TaxID=1848322 RepID=UPI001404B260|nr:four-carbon acid sugar kinase family protein [Nonomuraea deserti]